MGIKKEAFGSEYTLYTITNAKGTQVKVTDLGGTIVSILFQDKNEQMKDIVLGYDTPEEYMKNGGFLGAWVGRSGNRIGLAKFDLNGQTYQLPVNDNDNNLHSGPDIFSRRRADVQINGEDSITFTIEDKDLQQGYPGNFTGTCTYTLTDDDALRIAYTGECDTDTVCNMTNHSYFNLGGCMAGSVLDHEAQLSASFYTPVHPGSIPTGETKKVEKTPFDFLEPKPIGRDINREDKQLKIGEGYDHNFMIDRADGSLERFAVASCKETGIVMEALTTLPAFQLYTGNRLQGFPGKGGAAYVARQGFCLESQYVPNAINDKNFTAPVFGPDNPYHAQTCFRFTVQQ